MKLLNLLLIVICTLHLSGCAETTVPDSVSQAIDSIADKWIPVPEEGVRNFSLEPGTGNTFILKGETNVAGARNEIVEFLISKGIDVTDSLVILPEPSLGEKTWGLVTLSVCNMRTEPSHGAEMGTQAIMGTPVRILKDDGGWLLVQTPDSYLGWTNDAAVTAMTQEQLDAWKKSERIITTINYGVLTDEKGEVISDLVYGSIIEKTGEKGNSIKVKLPDGREGYVKRSDATDFLAWADRGEPKIPELISFARTLKGSPYLWGGTSTKGLDCSGYVKTIYFTGGVILTRDASSQYMYGTEVPLVNVYDSLQAGDLLFFGRMHDGQKRITHTGMYIGDSEVIHSSGMVKINSFDSTRVNYSKYLVNILLGAKRFAGAPVALGNMPVSQHNWYF